LTPQPIQYILCLHPKSEGIHQMLTKLIAVVAITHAIVVGIETLTDADIQGKKAEQEVRITSAIG